MLLILEDCLMQPSLRENLGLIRGSLMTKLLSLILDIEDEVAESANEVREGLEDKWLVSLRGIVTL